MSGFKLDCQACKNTDVMVPTKISKMSPIVVLIGWVLVLPSIFGILVSTMIFFSSISAGAEVAAKAVNDAEAAGAAIGTGLGMGFAVFFGVSSLISGLLGYLLIMKKKVFKCSVCGFILNRA